MQIKAALKVRQGRFREDHFISYPTFPCPRRMIGVNDVVEPCKICIVLAVLDGGQKSFVRLFCFSPRIARDLGSKFF